MVMALVLTVIMIAMVVQVLVQMTMLLRSAGAGSEGKQV